jgi:primosomal protein N' (replication factor Y)
MIVKVALAVAPNYLLDYKISEPINIFQRVLVSVGSRKLIGFVVDTNITVEYDENKIKLVDKVLDNNLVLVSKDIQKTIIWTANYYHSDIYNVIKLALPNEYFKNEIVTPKEEFYYEINASLTNIKLTAKQQNIINYLEIHGQVSHSKIKDAGFSLPILKKLIDNESVIKNSTLQTIQKKKNITSDLNKKLSAEQQNALDIIMQTNSFRVFLLYGVTGSGKTEIYLQSIQKHLNENKQVLILIPEINLTPQTVTRFTNRFPSDNIVTMHSKLSEKEKLTNWHHIKNGSANIVISTRSGVLADFKNLGMIIIDEEHDSSFKQQTSTIRYHARDLAVLRAKSNNIPIILGSATPSLESYYNAKTDKYELLKLLNRVSKHAPAEIKLLDLKSSIVANGVSNILLTLLENNINAHSQSLIFINKLGFAKALICKSCGKACECKKCDKPYTLHNYPNQYLNCHFCGSKKQIIIQCESCGSSEIIPYGTGTERVQKYLQEKFPYNAIVRFDRQSIKNNTQLDNTINDITDNKVDIIVGTQMISKGHHFENITLVGLVNIDSGFYSTDFHAVEKTAQLIVQVSGRAGRGDKKGLVILQTYQPDNINLQKLINNDYLSFLDYILKQREFANYPPYTFQAQILVESRKEVDVLAVLEELLSALKKITVGQISLPIPATHLKKNDVYRYSLLLTSKSRAELSKMLSYVNVILKSNNIKNGIKIYFDVDPIEF